ncbi:MAG: RecQ family ATP-dependent DNA helicase [Cyanobacteriota bacterium]|nr:RecQ family ATP-dependent DNA helicase [Cyanobacteriota bacterium]
MEITQLRRNATQLLRQSLNNAQVEFRNGQWEAIAQLLIPSTRLLVVQRTGWGKSVVYFIATRLLRNQGAGPALIISPLLALMRNQIAAAERIGIRAETINSTNSGNWEIVEEKILRNEVDVLLISPERLANDDFRRRLLLPMASRIGFLVVDEAHCISDWGHDFRPDYRRIVRILQQLPPTIPVLATTATANNRVIEDIKNQLGSTLKISRGPLTRASLHLQNICLPNQAHRLAWLAQHLPHIPGSGIIYALTKRDAERVASWLRTQGLQAEAYTSQSENREVLEERLLTNQVKALVATSALGMGFDKPDLGFVIHYQRPGSVVHYYQQVGRAGRAVTKAYGILLSGEEDEEIIDFFIRSAFPPEAHITEVLQALNASNHGLSVSELQSSLNLSKGKIEKILKILSLESPSPVVKQESRWVATPINYQMDWQKIEKLTQIRSQEQARMTEYANSNTCLMLFLAQELDDPELAPCGRCASCLGQPLIPITVSLNLVTRATQFLKRQYYPIEPRKRWPSNAMLSYGWRGKIQPKYQAEVGYALCLWGDDGWGSLVGQGKYGDGRFSDQLVGATVEMIRRWQPDPKPTWITCVPSLNRPHLVPDFAERVARSLGLPFIPCVRKIRATEPQKTMNNSFQQARNLDQAFEIEPWNGMETPVYLIDDMVDSRWTFTILTALLRSAGSGPVFPVALALNSLNTGE